MVGFATTWSSGSPQYEELYSRVTTLGRLEPLSSRASFLDPISQHSNVDSILSNAKWGPGGFKGCFKWMGQSRAACYSVSVQTEPSETCHSKKNLIHNGNEQMANIEVIFSMGRWLSDIYQHSTVYQSEYYNKYSLGIFFLISLFAHWKSC